MRGARAASGGDAGVPGLRHRTDCRLAAAAPRRARPAPGPAGEERLGAAALAGGVRRAGSGPWVPLHLNYRHNLLSLPSTMCSKSTILSRIWESLQAWSLY